ncbi:probable hexosyltransferase MUCI70 isoform X1 [Zingiber officinale]|uniref:probable hexosyltransferase MUCI70 isoform X1 n=2 Tax=Zingiber officinale TaxID=94328 RepID=UPI001C4C5ED2|nr:probable hexosyltransferase MUCI70 isoform X1 [Zingiber officinale]XP_042389799.1 probable hexosyltransferase MUCI70 isoform X1 [Zingiber officinale]
MTGVSLGVRSGSYGSLQQQTQNGSLFLSQLQPVTVRKPAKMSLSGSREKERIWVRICKFAGRRKVGMLLLLVVSVAVFSFISLFSKDEDASASSNSGMGFTDHVLSFVNPSKPTSDMDRPAFIAPKETNFDTSSSSVDESKRLDFHKGFTDYAQNIVIPERPLLNNDRPSLLPSKEPKVDTATRSTEKFGISHNSTQHSAMMLLSTPHPCETFSLPPPPADKKRTGPRPCPVCYVPVEQAVFVMPLSPSASPILKNLSYVLKDDLIANESNSGSVFGGHPSLQERTESFDIKESMRVHCGFAKGEKPGQGTGFDIDEADLLEMEKCHDVVVASAIFGNYDILQQPKNISDFAKKNACFYMFVDEETETYIKNSSGLVDVKRVGLWKVVVVRNLPYVDARRNGKVPKLLLHRLFPNARFSLWIDGKLELVVDPYQVLERFLWRKNYTFAISRHYRRFDVFEEAEANRAAGKYDNASIDFQIEFYKKEGLTPYSSSKLPITSDVPEGCVIIKEHIPITNLFTCLWFNEVDRFTSRDQISFSTVRDKLMSQVNWTINMFLDCERRNFVVQAYHRDLLEQRKALIASVFPPPAAVTNEPPSKTIPETLPNGIARATPPSRKLPTKIPTRHGRDKRSSSRHHHPKIDRWKR